MAKIDIRPKEKIRLDIEFADNGIILRNPELVDEVTLAVHSEKGFDPKGYDYTEEYKAIGKKVYDWLTDVVVCDHREEWIATGAEINITATLTGRKHE